MNVDRYEVSVGKLMNVHIIQVVMLEDLKEMETIQRF